MRLFSFFVLCSSLLIFSPESAAQSPLDAMDLSTVRSADISDAQLRSYVRRGQTEGISVAEALRLARERGLPASEATTLQQRIQELDMEEKAVVSTPELENRERKVPPDDTTAPSQKVVDEKTRLIFGSSIFREAHLRFEPSMNIPTPINYELGPSDELVIDIWGEATNLYRLEVSSEGTVTIDNLGPIYVHGLTIKEANNRIIEKLKTLYRGLRPGSPNQTTYVQVSLGRVRSIQVTIIGEVNRPGNYTVSSLATVFNALYKSGGPNNIGAYRDVQVIRGNEKIVELDIYDLLIHGDQGDNIRLHDQDIIKVDPYVVRVQIRGKVKRPGYFEMKEGESMSDLIRFAGHFIDSAYTRQLRLHRNTPIEWMIVGVKQKEFDTFALQNGDVVFVDEILDRFENRVTISGAVWRPGEFELTEGMTLHDLIMEADGLRPDAYRTRAIINRLKKDFDFEIVSFDVNSLIADPVTYDIPLKREDQVIIQTIFGMREEFTVSIEGEVREGGEFRFRENMTLEDLILNANGFQESASEARIEIFRRIIGEPAPAQRGDHLAESFMFNVSRYLQLSEEDKQFKLHPFDQVFVRRRPDYIVQQNVSIEGEVLYPGSYILLNRNERISDLIRRSGGLTNEAYISGARLIRADDNFVGIDLQRILAKPGSKDDLFLLVGDRIHISMKLQTVTVRGAVLRDMEIRYNKGKSLRYYVNRSGGFADDAQKRGAYVVYANGDINTSKSFLFFSFVPNIESGAKIIIPQKREERERMSSGERITIMTSVVSMAAIVVTAISRLF